MTVRVMIIDGRAEFRALLMHHLTTIWDDAVINVYDPVTAGHLPDEFSGAGNDMILLGSAQGERDPLATVRQFRRVRGFPALVYFGDGDAGERRALEKLGVDATFARVGIRHEALANRLNEILQARRRPLRADTPDIANGRNIGRHAIKGYRILRRLAATDLASVYLAERESDGARVVLKVLTRVPDLDDASDAFDRFLREYELIASLGHPGVIRIFDLGVSDDHAHIVMEYLPGGNLRNRIRKGLTEGEARSYLAQAAAALAEIHSVGILHRDLKPGNIMFRGDGTLVLIDFGLAKRLELEAEITGTGTIFGTPYYMSPEQGHADELDTRSDIYSLGVIFFEMLTGKKPYSGSSAMGIIYQHRNSPVPRLPAVFEGYQPLLDRMMAKRARDRLEHASEVKEWLDE